MLSQVQVFEALNKTSNILSKIDINLYIDINLDSSNKIFSNNSVREIREILWSIEITEDDYYWALFILPENDYVIHLQISSRSCVVNYYNPNLLEAREANLDIQLVHDYYKTHTYMNTHSLLFKIRK